MENGGGEGEVRNLQFCNMGEGRERLGTCNFGKWGGGEGEIRNLQFWNMGTRIRCLYSRRHFFAGFFLKGISKIDDKIKSSIPDPTSLPKSNLNI